MFSGESSPSQSGSPTTGIGEYYSNDKDLVVDKFSNQIPTNNNCDKSMITDEVKLKKLQPGKDDIVFCTDPLVSEPNSRQAV